jgi:hypothetical protein
VAKVLRDADYVRRAMQVVSIPTDLPIPEADLTRPRGEPDARVYDLAKRFALTTPVDKLAEVLAASGK